MSNQIDWVIEVNDCRIHLEASICSFLILQIIQSCKLFFNVGQIFVRLEFMELLRQNFFLLNSAAVVFLVLSV